MGRCQNLVQALDVDLDLMIVVTRRNFTRLNLHFIIC